MKQNLISIIIPLHNGADTINRAVKSVLNGTFYHDMIEVIIVENGSTDQSFEIAQKLATENSNIRVYQSDKGTSFARNLGIEKSKGKWLIFLDADDYLVESNLNIIIENLITNPTDLCVYNYEKGSKEIELFSEEVELINDLNPFIVRFLSEPTKYMTVWGKAFNKHLIDELGLKFNTNLRVSEDSDFYLRFLLAMHSLTLYPQTLYHYSIDSPSTMRTFSSDKLEGYIVSLDESSKALENVDDAIREAFSLYKLAHFNLIMVREVFHFDNAKSFREKLREMIRLYKMPMFSRPIQNLSISSVRNLSLVPLFFLKIHLYHLAALVYIIRVRQNKFKEGRKS